MAEYETHAHDVLVIGAGGAGLRAAIEAANAGARVGLVCKSLLGKAHTVMAEGGVAAALANVDDPDAFYLFQTRMAVVWPMDENGLVIGEDTYTAGDGFAGITERKLLPEDIAA